MWFHILTLIFPFIERISWTQQCFSESMLPNAKECGWGQVSSHTSQFSLFFFNYFIVVQLQLSAFSPSTPPTPQPNPLPSLASSSLSYMPGVLEIPRLLQAREGCPWCPGREREKAVLMLQTWELQDARALGRSLGRKTPPVKSLKPFPQLVPSI